jgi:hypothetical protein
VIAGLQRIARWLALAPLFFYRRVLSPLKPPMCRFQPTCSEYAIGAIQVHGVVRGIGLAVWRLLRCQPFARAGYDPVPPPRDRGARHPGCTGHDAS